jgi:hypothetical protein
VFINQGTKCVRGHRAIPYHGTIIEANDDGTFQVQNCAVGLKKIRTEPGYHIFPAPKFLYDSIPSSRDPSLAMKRLSNQSKQLESMYQNK